MSYNNLSAKIYTLILIHEDEQGGTTCHHGDVAGGFVSLTVKYAVRQNWNVHM